MLAADITVNAELSRNRVAAGEVVQLNVKVTGAERSDLPQEIPADGLKIKLTGESSQVQMINFAVSSSVLYSYIVIPLRAGTLTVPSITVHVEGRTFKTSPQQLTVVGAPSTSSSQVVSQPLAPTRYAPSSLSSTTRVKRPSNDDRLGFAELTIPKKKFYVGEVVPVEIRFYVDAHYDFSTMGPPNFGGEGVLTERFKDPQQDRVQRDGFIYNVATYHTMLSAVKAGPLDIAPANLNVVVAVPERMPAGMDEDLFSRLLGGRSPFVREHQLSLKTEELHCEVMPLPQEGRPDDFSGAVGEFHLAAKVTPSKAAQGDPVTLALALSGKGNFQAIKGPQLTETKGWRTYPPADHFEPADASGWKGTKTFETTMIAQEAVTATPGSLFSYFDPTAAKYVTLTTKPLPVEIMAAASAAPSVAAAPLASPVTTNAITPPSTGTTPTPLTTITQHYWQDPLHRKEFLIAWGALFLAAIVLACYLAIAAYQRRHQHSRHHDQQQLKKWISELHDKESDGVTFYDKAVACAELLLKKDPSRWSELEEIFKRRDEIHYGAREAIVPDRERERVLEKLASKTEKNSN